MILFCEDEWYIVIMAYKFTAFEILRDFFVLADIACPCYPYIPMCPILRVRAIPTYQLYILTLSLHTDSIACLYVSVVSIKEEIL